MPRLPIYDRLGWPAHDGAELMDGAMLWWEETRERVLAGKPVPDEDDEADAETHPCVIAGCPHLARLYAKRCPIHALQGEYEPTMRGVDWQERIW
jgi:hypothetical protein